jgi:hypothetical protein
MCVILAIIILVVLLAVCLVGEYQRSKIPATVIERQHTASSVGVGITSNGKTAVVSNPEKWELIVRDDNGNVYSVSVSAGTWASAKPGDRINDDPLEAR